MERPDLGRTEGFALARLAGAAAPGSLVRARVTGHGAEMLEAVPGLRPQSTRKSAAPRSRPASSLANRTAAAPPAPSRSKRSAPLSSL